MKAFFRILLLLCACVSLRAQDDQLDEFTIEDVPQEDVSTPYFGVGGGFIASFWFADLDAVNAYVDQSGMLPGQKLEAPILMLGAQGFAAVPFLPGSRVGFTSLGGSAMVEGTQTVDGVGAFDRRFEYSVMYNAISFDYAFVPVRGLAILPGAMIGWGTLRMRASQSPADGDRTAEGEFNFNQSTTNIYRELSTSYWALTPNLNIEYAITPFSMIRVNAGYNLSLSADSWEADNGIAPVSGVSEDIALNGLSAQVGLFVGLFNH